MVKKLQQARINRKEHYNTRETNNDRSRTRGQKGLTFLFYMLIFATFRARGCAAPGIRSK
jgi:hypothetical protein